MLLRVVLVLAAVAVGVGIQSWGLGAGYFATLRWTLRMLALLLVRLSPFGVILLAWGGVSKACFLLLGNAAGFALMLLVVTPAALVGAWLFERRVGVPRLDPWLEAIIGSAPGEQRHLLNRARSGQEWLERVDRGASGDPGSFVQEGRSGPGQRSRILAGRGSRAASRD